MFLKGEILMAEKIYIVVKLAPNVSSWCDKENNICLSRPNKVSKRLKEGCDMKMINKGVKAGLLILETHREEIKENPISKKEEIIKEVKAKRARKKAEEVVEINVVEEEEKQEIKEDDNKDKEE
jgi:beta-glucosidase-like glycosyl hydrolase